MSKISAPYLMRKRGIFYLQKRVPKQLIGKYGRQLIRKSLRTTDRFLVWGDVDKMGPALAVSMLTILYGYSLKLITIALAKD